MAITIFVMQFIYIMNIETLQTLCRSLPAVTEDIKWDHDLCFLVGGKMFCVASLEPPLRISFKVPTEEFDMMCALEGILPAPYMARAHWVSVTETATLTMKEWRRLIVQSHTLVAAKLTRKLRKELGLE